MYLTKCRLCLKMPNALTEQDILEAPQEELQSIPLEEAILLGAKSGMFFNRVFLADTFCLPPAPYQYRVIKLLDDPGPDHKALCIFRGGAKTSFCRARLLKKICYGLTHTSLVVSKSQGHATDTLTWLSRKVVHSKLIKKAFGLSIGVKDSQEEVSVVNPAFNNETFAMAVGMTGQLRGLNKYDHRPDFIICDDPCDEINTGTEEQREKTKGLFFGALGNTLASRAMVPTSEIVLVQTLLARGDLIDLALQSDNFVSMLVSVFNANGESAWPSMWTTEQLLREKQARTDLNQLHVWLREKEGVLIDSNTAAFKQDWIQIFKNKERELPDDLVYFIAVDPVPPPSDTAIVKNLHKKDWEVWTVIALDKEGGIWAVESRRNRGHTPDWSLAQFVDLLSEYKPLAVGVEGVNYQRVLSYLIEQKMKELRMYCRIHTIDDKRKKYNKILDNITGPASNGLIHIHSDLQVLITQLVEYPQVRNDDDIDSFQIAIQTANECYGGFAYDETMLDESMYPDLPEIDLCP